jgi:hypothetical protein
VQLQHGLFLIPEKERKGIDFFIDTETNLKGLSKEGDVELFNVICKHRAAFSIVDKTKFSKVEKSIDEFRHILFPVSRAHLARILSEMSIGPQALPYSLPKRTTEQTD